MTRGATIRRVLKWPFPALLLVAVPPLGLSAGLDLNDLALRLPGVGKVSLVGSG